MKYFKNPFAYDKDNNIIYMETGNESKKELYKNCHCPICNEILIPRMGKKNVWHFSHKGNSNCVGGLETGLHLYAKEVIKKGSKIFFPSINLGEAIEIGMFDKTLTRDIIKWTSKNDIENLYITIFKENKYDYTWVNSEIRINDFIPDSVIQINDKKVAVEICVTHNVDEVKRKKVNLQNLDMLEIYLNPKEIDKKQKENNFNLNNYILFEAERKWIYKTSNQYFDNLVRNIIYNEGYPIFNEKYSNAIIKERSKYFLKCPKCGGTMVERNSKNGMFYACSNYPKCKFTKKNLYDIKCPKCEKSLHLLKGKYGYFWGHEYDIFSFHECNFTRPIKEEEKFLIKFYYG